MADGRGFSVASLALCSLLLLLAPLTGCALLNGFFDPTAVGQFPLEYKERGIRRILTPRDSPPGLPNASEPTPQDLVPVYEDYRFVPGDTLMVSIQDLVNPGQPESANIEISYTGNIRIPLIGTVKASGLTEQEFEEELKARLRESKLLTDPDVRVYTLSRNGRLYTLLGSVGRAGQYPLRDPDTRLLEAIGNGLDIGATAQKLYVIRPNRTTVAAPGTAPFEEVPGNDGLVIPPPKDDQSSQAAFFTAKGTGAHEPPQDQAEEPKLQKSDLDAVAAPRADTRPATREAGGEKAGGQEELPFPPLILDPHTGKPVEEPRVAPPTEAAQPIEAPAEKPFVWEDVPEPEFEQRVIEIDVRALRSGDPRYNIVIRDKDTINVPVDTGVFYVMGEVNRPGVYSLNGRDITIKQAISLTGGLTPLGWPQRCEIIRHEPGTDKQITIPVNLDALFAGLEDDVFLRDDDIVNVGTHFVAPFLFVIRNSFRFTYGFGFVYDRNFADQDAYGARQNPEARRDQQRAARGLAF
jgi:polysaccharide biosynthesis/export protein